MGQWLMVAFFVLAAVAATGAMLSLMEVPVVILHERWGLSRSKATLLTIVLLVVLGSGCALSNSLLADFKLFGLNVFDLFDVVSSNVILPAGMRADKIGGRKVRVFLLFSGAVASGAGSFASSYPMLRGLAFLVGFVGNSFSVGIAWNLSLIHI